MNKADNFDTSKWLTENKITFQSRLTEEQYSSERVNPRDKEIQPGVVNHYFDNIDVMDLDNGYKVKTISTYYFRDPGTKGYNFDGISANSEENPGMSEIQTILMDPSGKPIKKHNFTGSKQWWMLSSGNKNTFIPYVVEWWNEKISRMGLSESKLNEDTGPSSPCFPMWGKLNNLSK